MDADYALTGPGDVARGQERAMVRQGFGFADRRRTAARVVGGA
jgi:hypothetical protein